MAPIYCDNWLCLKLAEINREIVKKNVRFKASLFFLRPTSRYLSTTYTEQQNHSALCLSPTEQSLRRFVGFFGDMVIVGVSVTLRKNHTLSQTILYEVRITFIHRPARGHST